MVSAHAVIVYKTEDQGMIFTHLWAIKSIMDAEFEHLA